ncbi:hypothetical protein M378DRAFT_17687 [Amanita muscaria Koide BX008]|uniref:Uncharacterized protein n=1 Tax=Amanita muscaria (strain Koide BX008) TaxID=946122 RepID=A0A0C2WGG8_AMAMK|nr:hypothetical protein M378DRAFT_17687 [Amanita muscaria Koide BX008]
MSESSSDSESSSAFYTVVQLHSATDELAQHLSGPTKDKKNSELESKSKPESKSNIEPLSEPSLIAARWILLTIKPFAPKHGDGVVDVKGRVYRVRANCAARPQLYVLTEVHKNLGPYIRRFVNLPSIDF